MALPRSSTSVLHALMQQRFVSLFIARSPFHRTLHRPQLNHTLSHEAGRASPSRINNVCSRSARPYSTQAALALAEETSGVSRPTSSTLSTAGKPKKATPRKRLKVEWTPEADAHLLQLRLDENKKWAEIGQALGREPATCMTRYEAQLNPALKTFWTPEKETELSKLVASSMAWPDIALSMGVHRLACMERWRILGLRELAAVDPAKAEVRRTKADEQRAQEKSRLLDKTQEGQLQQLQLQLAQVRRQPLPLEQDQDRGPSINLKSVEQIDKNLDRSSWNSLMKDEKRYTHYRSWKKQNRLDAFSQLYLMNPGWSAKEETILIQFVLANGLNSWDVLAKNHLKSRFSAAECRTSWKNLDMPVAGSAGSTTSMATVETSLEFLDSRTVTKPEAFIWDKELSVRLQTLIRQAYKQKAVHIDEINWLWVARKIHPEVTSRMCKNHWKFLHERPSSSSVVWHHEDVRRLEEGIRLLGPKKLTAIRDHFLPKMTKDDIMRHWLKISDKATAISEEDYYQLLDVVQEIRNRGVRQIGMEQLKDNDNISARENDKSLSTPSSLGSADWAEVAKRLGAGWTKSPCKRVWESSFQNQVSFKAGALSSSSKAPVWTSYDDNTLLRMVKFVGRDDWYSVSKALQSGRSAWQCRLRWCQLLDPVQLDTPDLTVQGEFYC
ncbi:hypothetical protein EMPS_10840 [Entomortierella parvispora]|uniref:Uncharacterized protein n=1 Tax=Entomortierella parvispora TaxID=205924 RepID=A0A9P3HKT8_9FUNG|nr:hypothetical protein EMPS_10840 [Entomortierella parvispora]